VDIAALVKFMSEVTGKNFILDDRLHGKLTIISPTKMAVDEAYRAFQSALQLKGFTTVRVGAVIKIMPSKDAKSAPIDTVFPQ
jgi:general secretion pathway protein D